MSRGISYCVINSVQCFIHFIIVYFLSLYTFPVLCQDGDIRLQGGASELEGRIELCNDETWGTVCDRVFGTSDGNVACRQLGFAPIGTSSP